MEKLIVICALLSTFYGNAQILQNRNNSNCKIRRIECEVGVGAVFGADKLNFDENRLGATFFAEGRYNLSQLPLDIGIQMSGTIFHRDSDNAGELKFKTWNVMGVSDYNFRQCKNVSFFAGVGLGYASLDNSAPISFDDSEPNWGGFSTGDKTESFCFMPRVGVEFLSSHSRHIRV